jgi:competence protein ComEC
VGFQLSFSAVYGLCMLAGPVEMAMLRLNDCVGGKVFLLRKKWFTGSLSATLAATLATAPVQCFHFYYFYPYAVVTNLIILPSVFVVVGLGIVVGILGLVSVGAALPLAGTLYFMLNFYERICGFIASLPGAELLTGAPQLTVCAALYALMLCAAYTINGGQRGFHRRKYLALGGLVFLCTTICFSWYERTKLAVTLLDVGQGDCIVIERGGYSFVIDGGGQWGREYGANTGVNVLIPYLEYRGIERLDGVFVTHTDNDHAAGIVELIEYGGQKIDGLYVTDYASAGETGERLLGSAAEYGIPTVSLTAGDSLRTGATGATGATGVTGTGTLTLDCLYPTEGLAVASVNETSLVLRLQYKNASFLFTGDIDAEAEAALIKNGGLAADVLKIPHHGSKYSSSEAFVAAVNPSVALVTAGVNNVYGFPTAEAMAVYAQRGVPVFGTHELGAVTVISDGEGYEIRWMIE